jgi:hypothetical protein
MKIQVDSRPTNESGSNIKNNPVSRKPKGEERRHHKGINGVTTGKTRVQNFSRALGEFRRHFQEKERSLPVNEIFETVKNTGLDAIEKKKAEDDLSLFC